MRNTPAGNTAPKNLVPETGNTQSLNCLHLGVPRPAALGSGAQGPVAPGQRMTDLQRILVTNAIQAANPRPDDVEACVLLVLYKKTLSPKKVETFLVELQQVCEEALGVGAARDARPPTPPSAISESNSADPVPGTLQDDGALQAAAARSVKDTVGHAVAKRPPTLRVEGARLVPASDKAIPLLRNLPPSSHSQDVHEPPVTHIGPSPYKAQLDDSCAGLGTQSAKTWTPQPWSDCTAVFLGPDAGRQAASFVTSLCYHLKE
ncbi:hypothetical protein F5883DRAFT_153670 [Diaporthe sp. PMI_573]|jgi:hypothetical protein|nr:hypothetical protein F5883DRAFT_153670 [Diaporthaceae sp. PMI_573]